MELHHALVAVFIPFSLVSRAGYLHWQVAAMYEADIKGGRPSIAPGKLLRAMLLQALYSVRSERQLMEQTQYNLLFRWFIGLAMDWLSGEHFSVDGTLIQAWAGYKSFVPKDGGDNDDNDGANFKGQAR